MLFVLGCSSGSGGNSGRYRQDPAFVRDMADQHRTIAARQDRRTGGTGDIGRKSWRVVYCPREGSGGVFGDWSCNCAGLEGICIHAWDQTAYGSWSSTRGYVGVDPVTPVIDHEEGHATLARKVDNPAEIANHPTGHPPFVTIGGRRYSVRRDILDAGTRWPMPRFARRALHGISRDQEKWSWEDPDCGYIPPPLPVDSQEPAP